MAHAIAKGADIHGMDDQVHPLLGPGDLLVDAVGIGDMIARAQALGARLANDQLDSLHITGMGILFGNAQATAQVMGADEYCVQPFNRENLVQYFQCRHTFDVDDGNVVIAALGQVGGQFRFQRHGAVERVIELGPFERTIFHRADQLAHLLGAFNVGGDDALCAAIEHHRRQIWIRAGNTHNWHHIIFGVKLTHPGQLRPILGRVLRVQKGKIQPSPFGSCGPPGRNGGDHRAIDPFTTVQPGAHFRGIHLGFSFLLYLALSSFNIFTRVENAK